VIFHGLCCEFGAGPLESEPYRSSAWSVFYSVRALRGLSLPWRLSTVPMSLNYLSNLLMLLIVHAMSGNSVLNWVCEKQRQQFLVPYSLQTKNEYGDFKNSQCIDNTPSLRGQSAHSVNVGLVSRIWSVGWINSVCSDNSSRLPFAVCSACEPTIKWV